MKFFGAIFSALILVMSSCDNTTQPFSMNLYPEGEIPNYQDVGEQELWDTTNIVRVKQVQIPDIKVYLPESSQMTREAVVICPGGGYHILAYDWEGEDIAEYWNSKGVAAIVLKYRSYFRESD